MTKSGPYKIVQLVKHRISTIEVWDNNIVYIKIDDNEEIQLEDSINHNLFVNSVFDGKNKVLILVEPGEFTQITKEARDFASKFKNNEFTLATAVIIKSLSQRLIMNFITKLISPKTFKMKLFEDKDEAIDWLLTLKK